MVCHYQFMWIVVLQNYKSSLALQPPVNYYQTKYMPKKFLQFFEGHNIYVCKRCKTHLSALTHLISKHYRSQHGNAYLFDIVVNVRQGQFERRRMTSGFHTVCDIFCVSCENEQAIGWKYIQAQQQDQKFKQNRYILSEVILGKEAWTDD